jgi:RNA polymerase sigma factor (sigma-70 family)
MVGEQLTRVLRQIHHLVAACRAEELSDAQALERFVAAREEAAFRALVRRHGPLVWGVCRRVLRHEQDAEDAFQATFLVLAERAGSIRRPESVGSWLYGVAYHIALEARGRQARRGMRERQVEHMPQPESPAESLWAELAPVLDEELQRLPEQYRRPLVLCYLEGKSYREAAEELGWPLGSTSKRLARARELLRQGLKRRGVTLSGGLLTTMLTGRAAPAAPPALVDAAVRAGLLFAAGRPLAGIVSAHAAALFQKGAPGMSLPRLKIATALVLLLGGLGLGALTLPAPGKQFPLPRTEDRFPQPTPSKPDRPSAANPGQRLAARSRPEAAELRTLTGRVEDPVGKPVVGARVVVLSWPPDARTPEKPYVLGRTKTDARGRYRLRVTIAGLVQPGATLAAAEGYGLGWSYLTAEGGAVIRLAREQVLRVRLIDLQGQPAAGVKVHVCRVGKPAPAPLEHRELVKLLDTVDGGREELGIFSYKWEALYSRKLDDDDRGKGTKSPALRFREPPPGLPVWPGPVTTDARGRLVLRGLPRNVGIGLLVRDRRFALQALAINPQARAEPRELTLALAPARVLEGTVVDAATGKPVPGAVVRVPTRAAEVRDSVPADPSIGEMDWKGRWGTNGYRLRNVAAGDPSPAAIKVLQGNRPFGGTPKDLPEVSAPDELPRVETRADRKGRYRLPLFVADSYTVAVSGPGTGPYLNMTRTVPWPKKAAARHPLTLSLPRGVWVKGQVTERPAGRPVAGARVDFYSPGLQLPAGVSFPAPLVTGRDGRFEALLPPGTWHLLVNCASGTFVRQKIAAAKVTGKRTTRVAVADGYDSIVTVRPDGKDHFFYPDGWAALDLKPGEETRQVTVKLRRFTLRGKLLGPDGKPVARALLFYRHPMPPYRGADATVDKHQVVWKLRCPVRGEPAVVPVEVKDGKFELPLVDVGAKYHLYFLDARNKWGAVAEVSGKEKEPAVRMMACGRAKARLVDAQGKPRAGYRPLLWLLLPPGPHPAVRHSRWEGLAPDSSFIPPLASFHTPPPGSNPPTFGKVWWANADPLHYGKGFQTDAKGNITFPALIPGATYRIFDPGGRAKDFTVEAGKTLDLKDVTIKQVDPR